MLDNLSQYLTLWNDGQFDETYDEFMATNTWHLGGYSNAESPIVPSSSPWWKQYDFNFMHTEGLATLSALTKIELLTQGCTNVFMQGSTNYPLLRPYVLFVGAKDYPLVASDFGFNEDHYVDVPDADITVFSKQPSNGVIVTNIADYTVLEATPSLLSTYTNFAFSVSALRVVASIVPYFSGPITPLITNSENGSITGPDYYQTLTNTRGLYLGPQGPSNTDGKHYCNLAEFRAQVPSDHPVLLSGWAWHRDINGRRYSWDPVTDVVVLEDQKTNTLNVPVFDGNDNPKTNAVGTNGQALTFDYFTDQNPDASNTIFDHDGPTLRSTSWDDAVIGTILAVRFNAKQWLTWNGALASNIIEYSGKHTIKKISSCPNAWVIVGSSVTNSEHLPDQDLEFSSTEAASY